jgi:hypothetical protein
VRVVVHVPRQLTGPLARHAVVGEAIVYSGRRVAARVRLILARALPAVSPVADAVALIGPSTLLVLMFAVGGLLAGQMARRRRPTHPLRAIAGAAG